MKTTLLALVFAAGGWSALAGCGGDAAKPSSANKTAAAPVAAATTAAPATSAAAPAKGSSATVRHQESDFVENERNRDPFRTFTTVLAPTDDRARAANVQTTTILQQYGLDELKLIAVVQGSDYPRAMLLDPQNKGWVVKKGDFLARPEIVHIGGANGTDYQVIWRVDRVRDGEVVLRREDPAQPGIPPVTRILQLRPEGERQAEKLEN